MRMAANPGAATEAVTEEMITGVLKASRAHRPDLVETARTRVDTQPARYSPTI